MSSSELVHFFRFTKDFSSFYLCWWHIEIGSLAGAAHLLNNNTGVQRRTQTEQKSVVDEKAKCPFDLDFQHEYKPWKWGLSIHFKRLTSLPRECLASEREGSGVGKVTTGITGLWLPSVQSDVAFWFFDVGSSYTAEAEFGKVWIVHPLKGNVSWV